MPDVHARDLQNLTDAAGSSHRHTPGAAHLGFWSASHSKLSVGLVAFKRVVAAPVPVASAAQAAEAGCSCLLHRCEKECLGLGGVQATAEAVAA